MSARRAFRFSFLGVVPLVIAMAAPLPSAERPDSNRNESLPERLVRRALEAEIAGDADLRNRLLADARRIDPDFAPSHWHAGFVQLGDEWLAVEEAERRTAEKGFVDEYRSLRDRHAGTAEGQVALAQWCRKKRLFELEKLHWRQVLQLTPNHQEARRRAGVREHGGLLLTDEQIRADRDLVERREKALAVWKPRVHRWGKALEHGDATQRAAALDELRTVTDPIVIPLLEQSLSNLDAEVALAVVATIAEMQGQAAADSLLRHAVLSEEDDVRRAAAGALSNRSWFAYVPVLMGSLQTPLEFSYYAQTLANGADVGFTIEREGPTARYSWSHGHRSFVHFTYGHIHDGELVAAATVDLPDPETTARSRTEVSALHRKVADANAQAESLNEIIFDVLETATKQKLERTPQAWWDWWIQYNELQAERDKPTQERRTANVTSTNYSSFTESFTPQPAPPPSTARFVPASSYCVSCFLPGTPVATNVGPLPIERVRPGDYVLSQHPATAELQYRPVVDTTVRPPSPTLRIGVGKEEIVATRGHPLWVAGEGWVMAKELRVGDHLHGLRGPARIDYIEPGPESQAFNLVVADHHNYFVGGQRILAHDNLARRPTRAKVPGLSGE
jgi:hypothetical protein